MRNQKNLEINTTNCSKVSQYNPLNPLISHRHKFQIGDMVWVYMPKCYPSFKEALVIDFGLFSSIYHIRYCSVDVHDAITIVEAPIPSSNIYSTFEEAVNRAKSEGEHVRGDYKKYSVDQDIIDNFIISIKDFLSCDKIDLSAIK